jgi:uncharacterized membrane protein
MSEPTSMTDAPDLPPASPLPAINRISWADVTAALSAGAGDLKAAPLYGLTVGILFAAGGWAIIAAVTLMEMSYLAYPLAAGFALIGPFAAVALYEVSRRREAGQSLGWGPILASVKASGGRELGWMAFVTLFIFLMWMYQIRLLLALFLGFSSAGTLSDFVRVILTTPEGWMFLGIGHIVGAVLSLTLFSLTAVSFPLLLERDVDFITAMITSVRAVLENPVPMLGWAALITFCLVASILSGFVLLALTLPLFGHATWHLYRKLVPPQAG